MIAQIPQVDGVTFHAQVLSSPLPVMVEFFSPTCPHCRRMQPIIESTARNYADRVRVVQANALQDGELARRFQIYGVPTVVFFVNGTEIDRIVGEVPQEVLENHLQEALARVTQPG